MEVFVLFMFWTNPEVKSPSGALAWHKLYPNFKVFSEADVLPLLPSTIAPLWSKIGIPAAKSDLARLLLLREYGGLYVDSHVGPTDPEELVQTIDLLSSYALVLFGHGWDMKSETDFSLTNSVIAARKKAPELDSLISLVCSNIIEQHEKELATDEYVPYDLWGMTGTYPIIQTFFGHNGLRPIIKDEFDGRVCVYFMKDNESSGFQLAANKSYQTANNHWSLRQKTERFFV